MLRRLLYLFLLCSFLLPSAEVRSKADVYIVTQQKEQVVYTTKPCRHIDTVT